MNKLTFYIVFTTTSLLWKIMGGGLLLVMVSGLMGGLRICALSIGALLIGIAVLSGWVSMIIIFFYKCPHCHKRALVTSSLQSKRIELSNSDHPWRYVLAPELIEKAFHCGSCQHKISASQK